MLALDGQPIVTPFSTAAVAGIRRTIEAPALQTIDGVTYSFDHWEGFARGKRGVLDFPTPSADSLHAAVYRAQ